MSDESRVRVYMACSLDGYIAGPDDDLSWLHHTSNVPQTPAPPSEALEFDAFMAQVGAMLMGRRTYDVIAGFDQWAYGDTPVLVATRRPLETRRHTVRAIRGDIHRLVDQAKDAAGDRDVYLDGGNLIRQALDAGLVNEMILTIVPILLTDGIRLFDGLANRRSVEFVSHHRYGHDKVQCTLRVG